MNSLGNVSYEINTEIKKFGLKEFNEKIHYKGGYKFYLDFSKYGKHLASLIETFGNDSIIFIKYEDVFNRSG